MSAVAAPQVHDVFSDANRRRFAVWSWTPPAAGPFPLLVLLHGVYDSGGHGWWLRARVHEQITALMTEGVLVDPPVVVMPTDTGAEFGSAYSDWDDGTTRAETWIADELLDWAAATLPVDGRRWVTGLSMGGFGALLLALRRPGTFASATSTSGFFRPDRLFAYGGDMRRRIWGDSDGQAAHDVTRLVTNPSRRAGLRLAFDCGTGDPHLEDNRELHVQLVEQDIVHGYAEHAGGHDWDYWRAHVADHVWFHAGVPGPLTTAATVEVSRS